MNQEPQVSMTLMIMLIVNFDMCVCVLEQTREENKHVTASQSKLENITNIIWDGRMTERNRWGKGKFTHFLCDAQTICLDSTI